MMKARKSTAKFAGLVKDLANEREQRNKALDEGSKIR